MTNEIGINVDGSYDPEYRHPDGRLKSLYERQDYWTRQAEQRREAVKEVDRATAKPDTDTWIDRRMAELKRDPTPGNLRRVRQLQPMLDKQNAEKEASKDHAELVTSKPYLEAVEDIQSWQNRSGSLESGELDLLSRATNFLEAGAVDAANKELDDILASVTDRVGESLAAIKARDAAREEEVTEELTTLRELSPAAVEAAKAE